jgi:hypothetical protein
MHLGLVLNGGALSPEPGNAWRTIDLFSVKFCRSSSMMMMWRMPSAPPGELHAPFAHFGGSADRNAWVPDLPGNSWHTASS